MLDNNSIGNTFHVHMGETRVETLVDTSSATEGCTTDFDQCDQIKDACTIHSQRTLQHVMLYMHF